MSKHTPGPWNYDLWAANTRNGGWPRGISGQDRDCGYIDDEDPPIRVATIEPEDCASIDEAIANARLIAAAPDLLAACEAWMEFNTETASENPCPDLLRRGMLRNLAAKLSMAAIAKAKGENK